jgi:inosine-uridine nucleoside N-ribohydrolase
MPALLTLALGLLLSGITSAQTPFQRRKLIIDQDSFGPGVSNLQAILLALQSSDVDVLGITVERGDGWVGENVAHLLRMLELIGRTDVKVYLGVTYPLINSPEGTKRPEAMYGKLAYKGAWTEEWEKYNSTNRTSYHGPHVIPAMREGAPAIKANRNRQRTFLFPKSVNSRAQLVSWRWV